MKVKILVNTGGYDEGETYEVPTPIGEKLVDDKLAVTVK